MSDKKPNQQYLPCAVCNGKHAIWSCSVYEEKTPTQRAKFAAEQKLCFSCLQSDHTFWKCPKSRKCNKPDCNSTHNALLHGAEKIYPGKDSTKSPAEEKISSHSASLEVEKVKGNCATSVLRVGGLLQIVELKLSSSKSSSNTLGLCGSACSHSWISAQLAEKLKLSGGKLNLTVSGINSQQV